MAGGIDLYARQNLSNNYVSYDTQSIGGNVRLGFGLSEELTMQPRYSIYQQKISLPNQYNDCQYSSLAPTPGVSPTAEAAGLDTFVNGPTAVMPTVKLRSPCARNWRRARC